MARLLFIGILLLYFFPLALVIVCALISRNFHVRSELINVIAAVSEQFSRIRDILGTVFVPFLSIYAIHLDKTQDINLDALTFAIIFITSAGISLAVYGVVSAAGTRLEEYGVGKLETLQSLTANYSRETLIFFASMIGVSVAAS